MKERLWPFFQTLRIVLKIRRAMILVFLKKFKVFGNVFKHSLS